MKILTNMQQGSDAWARHRARARNASDASALMGASLYKTRAQLLRERATGIQPEYDNATLARFERGHAVEAEARPIAAEIVGEDLFPIIATTDDGYLSASLDGATMLGDVIWECKLYNQAKAAVVREGQCPEQDYWQVQQQLEVTGAERCLYMVTDGTEEGSVWIWVYPNADDIAALYMAWKQFDSDLQELIESGAPASAPAAQLVAKTPDNLPALQIQVSGEVVASNVREFEAHALAVLESLPQKPETDQEFADAERVVKWLKEDVEDRLKSAKEHALQQTADIYELFSAVDRICEEARKRRLALNKAVTDRKQELREEIVREGREALRAHMAKLDDALGKLSMPDVPADFAGAVKGKRSFDSMRAAVDQEVARAKVEASAIADRMQVGLAVLREEAKGYEALFTDAQQLVQKDADDLRAVITARILQHKQAEEERQAAEAARKQAEEEAAQRQEEAARRREQVKAGGAPVAPQQERKTAAELYEAAENMRLAAQHAESRDIMRAEMAMADSVEAKARRVEEQEKAGITPDDADVLVKEAPKPNPARHTEALLFSKNPLMKDLIRWRTEHNISSEALDDLLEVLSQHQLLAAA